MSTTALLRWVHQQTDGDITRAITILRSLNHAHAKSALRVLESKLRSHPGSTTFVFAHNGFIELGKAA